MVSASASVLIQRWNLQVSPSPSVGGVQGCQEQHLAGGAESVKQEMQETLKGQVYEVMGVSLTLVSLGRILIK